MPDRLMPKRIDAQWRDLPERTRRPRSGRAVFRRPVPAFPDLHERSDQRFHRHAAASVPNQPSNGARRAAASKARVLGDGYRNDDGLRQHKLVHRSLPQGNWVHPHRLSPKPRLVRQGAAARSSSTRMEAGRACENSASRVGRSELEACYRAAILAHKPDAVAGLVRNF